jgi:hypothetical protein
MKSGTGFGKEPKNYAIPKERSTKMTTQTPYEKFNAEVPG